MLLIKKKILNFVLFFSLLTLSIAYFIEHILDHQPCNLCLLERIPYISAVILISLIFIIKRYEKTIMIFIAFFFICGGVVSFYHLGIEQGFFSESLVCNLGKVETDLTANDLLRELEKKTISCKEVTIRFFGLSLATINTVISFFLGAIIFREVKNYEKN
tara:strand:+ start:111 stop:590 length:480 start_codon:yes stop_codon:yes gene_type:complete